MSPAAKGRVEASAIGETDGSHDASGTGTAKGSSRLLEEVAISQRVVIVLGPHRSGTSAVARVLNLLGVDLGNEMLPPKFDNQLGYWEHRRVFEIHERVLSAIGSAWHEYRPLAPGWQRRVELEGLRQELAGLVRSEFGSSALWGVKDPRLCRLLPLWRDLLGREGVNPAFVLVVRNPLEVVQSIQERDRFSRSKAVLLYLTSMLDAIGNTSEHPRVFVSYPQLLEDWRAVADHVAATLHLDWPIGRAASREIESYLMPSERHHTHSTEELERDPSFPAWSLELQAALELAATGRLEALPAALERAQDALSTGNALFVPELDHFEHRLHDAEAAQHGLEAALQQQQQEPPRLEAARHQQIAEREWLEAAAADREREWERERQQLQAALAESHMAIQAAERRAERVEGELQKVQGHLTGILSSPFYRSTRRLRSWLGGLARWTRHLRRALRH